ncbi:18205_t:CDS:10, partial [Acaulospora morrowiae]
MAAPINNQSIKTFTGLCMNVNNMIGSGIFSTSGLIWYLTGSGGMTLCLYIIGFLFSLMGSFIYVELGSNIPESGGEQRYLERSFPNPNRLIGYIFSFCTITGAIVTDVIIASEYIIYAKTNDTTTLNPEGYTLTLLIISIIGLAEITKNPGKLTWNAMFSGTKGLDNFGNYCSSMLQVLFAYEGWNNLNYSLSEMNDAPRRLKISNPFSVVLVSILYILGILSFITIVDHDEAHRGTYKEIMSATIGDVIDFRRGLSILIALSSIGASASMVWSGSRIIASAADSDFIPYFSPLLREFLNGPNIIIRILGNPNGNNVDGRHDAPIVLITMTQYSALIFFGLSALGLLVLRNRRQLRNDLFKVPEIIVYLFLAITAIICIGAFVPAETADS